MSAPVSSQCCGVGKPADDSYEMRGSLMTVRNVTVYRVSPATNGLTVGLQPLGVIVLFPDGFGLAKHNFLLADTFAAYGWDVWLPDIYQGDPVPIVFLKKDDPGLSASEKQAAKAIDIDQWLLGHPHDVVTTMLRRFIEDVLLQSSHGSVHVVGYCFGGKHALRASSWDSVRATAAFHPSFVERDDVQETNKPIFIGLGEKDDMVPSSLEDDLRKWIYGASLNDGERRPFKEIVVYQEMGHGFAARPDTADPLIRAQYIKALMDTVRFLTQSLLY